MLAASVLVGTFTSLAFSYYLIKDARQARYQAEERSQYYFERSVELTQEKNAAQTNPTPETSERSPPPQKKTAKPRSFPTTRFISGSDCGRPIEKIIRRALYCVSKNRN